MRLLKALQILFLLSLTLALFGGELVESYSLTDDVSNDLIQVSATPVHKCANLASCDLIQQEVVTAVEKLTVNPAVISFAGRDSSSASDLLRLLSIQRK